MSLGRRHFLTWGGVGLGAAALGAAAAPASAASTGTATGPLWRLEHDWGFPLGPAGRTSCNCGACAAHGANKVFFSRADAENGRAHVGCCCLAVPVDLGVAPQALRRLSRDGRSVDRRDPTVAALIDAGGR